MDVLTYTTLKRIETICDDIATYLAFLLLISLLKFIYFVYSRFKRKKYKTASEGE